MPELEIRDMQPSDEYFVGTCSHCDESSEIDACGKRRIAWLDDRGNDGARAKVALVGGTPVGFLYVMPIEISPWGPVGRDLMAVPCLYVKESHAEHGIGTALLQAAEDEAHKQGRRGIVLIAVDRKGWWFMPATFFESRGYAEVGRRRMERLLWKPFDEQVEAPTFLQPSYEFQPVPGKVVIDLFWCRFCLTSDLEAQRVREVSAEFGDRVVLNDHPACDPETLRTYQIPRGIFVDGIEVSWGYEAPRDGIRETIRAALLEH